MKNRAATSHYPIAMGVLCLHFAAIALVTRGFDFGRYRPIEEKSEAIATAFIIDERAARDSIPISEVAIRAPSPNSITQIQFESEEWGNISGVTASFSAPRLSQFQLVNPAPFAHRAGLAAGQAAAVVLTVEILPDGTVGTVEVTRGFGDPAVDAAAVAYARLLRWVPGTQNHHAQAMRINLPVTLVWNA